MESLQAHTKFKIRPDIITAKRKVRTTVSFSEVGQLAESGGIAQRDEDHAVMRQSRESSNRSRLLSTTETASGHEDSSIFAMKLAMLP